MNSSEVLVAYSDVEHRRPLVNILADCNFRIAIVETIAQAGSLISERPMHLGFCEEGLPDGGYRELLHRAIANGSQTPLVVCGPPEQYLAAMAIGAFDYISPPYCEAAISLILNRRREPRTEFRLPVQIYGVDANGNPFCQSAWTRNVSNRGALLEGVSCELPRDAVVGVACHDRQTNCRVVWTARSAENEGYEIGLETMTIGTAIWDLGAEARDNESE